VGGGGGDGVRCWVRGHFWRKWIGVRKDDDACVFIICSWFWLCTEEESAIREGLSW
jgi:hypothetical protein